MNLGQDAMLWTSLNVSSRDHVLEDGSEGPLRGSTHGETHGPCGQEEPGRDSKA